MSLASTFKNFGHAIAAGAKYLEVAVVDVVKFSAKAQVLEPEVSAVLGAIAGPQAALLSDLAFHSLGSIAQALDGVNQDALGDVASKGFNVQMDLQTIADVKAAVALIKQVLAAKGTPAPAPVKP